MELAVKKIAQLINGQVQGDPSKIIKGVAGLQEAGEFDISFLKDEKNSSLLSETKAGAVIVPDGTSGNGTTLILVKNPLAAFVSILNIIAKEKFNKKSEIHPSAVISKTAKIGKDVSVGPLVVIEDDAEVGDGTVLMAQVYLGCKSKIGKDSLLYPQVVIREEVSIGSRCVLHSGTVIGSDGYGFYFSEGRHNKIPQIGTVVIEDDVELGAGCAVDRATTGITLIKKGTKIDNLVHIAHNVEVGENCLLAGQVGIAGSSKLGNGVVFAGQVGVGDHVKIGDGVQVGGQSGIKYDVPAGSIMFGSPAQPIQDTIKQFLFVKKLPELFKEFRKLKGKSS